MKFPCVVTGGTCRAGANEVGKEERLLVDSFKHSVKIPVAALAVDAGGWPYADSSAAVPFVQTKIPQWLWGGVPRQQHPSIALTMTTGVSHHDDEDVAPSATGTAPNPLTGRHTATEKYAPCNFIFYV